MSRQDLQVLDLQYNYPDSPDPVLDHLSAVLPQGWTGIVGPNGIGKTTLLRLICGELSPSGGSIELPGDTAFYCRQTTEDIPDELETMLTSPDGEAHRIAGILHIEYEWLNRWPTLSHGERKRAQIAVALWKNPSVLALDEPTNHVDGEGRQYLETALRQYNGVGLMVSHDRALLDTLCGQCLFLEPSGTATLRPGGYSQGAAEQSIERQNARDEFVKARRERKRLEREVQRRRQEAARSKARRSKKHIAKKDHDAKEKIDRAIFFGSDGKAGRLKKQMDARLDKAIREEENLLPEKDYEHGIWMSGEISHHDPLVFIPKGRVSMGGHRALHHPDLTIRPDSRIAIEGPNGAGKSTLLNKIKSTLTIPSNKIIWMPQEISEDDARRDLREAKRLDHDILGGLMACVRRLGSDPEALLNSESPSPGELRKLRLALGIAGRPHCIIMDEPTNHLDLPSVECLESALDDCPCALLLVSHDRRFMANLCRQQWRISKGSDGNSGLSITNS